MQKTEYATLLDDMASLVVNAARSITGTDELHTRIDTQYARLFDRLYHDFITPVERDDIARLGQGLCRLERALERISSDCKRYRTTTDIPCDLQPVFHTLSELCEQVKGLLTAFWQFRKDNAWWKLQQKLYTSALDGHMACRNAADAFHRLVKTENTAFSRDRLYTDAADCFCCILDIADSVAIAVLKNI